MDSMVSRVIGKDHLTNANFSFCQQIGISHIKILDQTKYALTKVIPNSERKKVMDFGSTKKKISYLAMSTKGKRKTNAIAKVVT